LFYPSLEATETASRVCFWILAAALFALGAAAYFTIHLDHPFLIGTNSRALYVDEGFYSDAAQNFAKFGRWGFPLDFPHWAGAPFLTFIQSLLFTIFGANLETARMLSVVMTVISGFAFYSLSRMSMRPAAALFLTLCALLTITYVTHARSALVEPTAICLSLLALLTYARMRSRLWSVPLSVALAFASFLSKMYFLFTVGAITGLWILELILVPVLTGRRVDWNAIVAFAASLVVVTAAYLSYLNVFGEQIADYYIINSDKAPALDIGFIVSSLAGSFKLLSFNTKADVFLLIILLVPVCFLTLLLWPVTRERAASALGQLGRADLAMAMWVLTGLLAVSLLNTPKTHYKIFAIMPLCFIGAVSLKLILPYRLHTIAIVSAALLHLIYQLPFYHQWSQRQQQYAIVEASREVARTIEGETDQDMIPVIGEYAAELGLFSDRIFSLDVKWAPSYPSCRRLEVWKPRFHVNIVWPGSPSQGETDIIENCRITADTIKVKSFSLFKQRGDRLVLSRIEYE